MKVTFAGTPKHINGKPFPPTRDYKGELDNKLIKLETEIIEKLKQFEKEHNIFLLFNQNPRELTAVIDFENSIF